MKQSINLKRDTDRSFYSNLQHVQIYSQLYGGSIYARLHFLHSVPSFPKIAALEEVTTFVSASEMLLGVSDTTGNQRERKKEREKKRCRHAEPQETGNQRMTTREERSK